MHGNIEINKYMSSFYSQTKKYIFSLSNTFCTHWAHVGSECIFGLYALRGALVGVVRGFVALWL